MTAAVAMRIFAIAFSSLGPSVITMSFRGCRLVGMRAKEHGSDHGHLGIRVTKAWLP